MAANLGGRGAARVVTIVPRDRKGEMTAAHRTTKGAVRRAECFSRRKWIGHAFSASTNYIGGFIVLCTFRLPGIYLSLYFCLLLPPSPLLALQVLREDDFCVCVNFMMVDRQRQHQLFPSIADFRCLAARFAVVL